jgi:acetylornithine deacetylase/succinyl-diaminopimelate desuccinylase-like protein
LAPRLGGEAGVAVKRLLEDPRDATATALVARTPAWRAMLTTTCIPTLVEGGHASNAQPQRAKVTYNCRLLPPGDMDDLKRRLTTAFGEPDASVEMLVYNGTDRALASPLTDDVMRPVHRVAAEIFPGVPVVAMQETFGTDGSRLIKAGIPTYGISGMFRGFDGGNLHGLDEHISVRSVMDGRDFLHRLVQAYAEQ